MNKRGNEYVTLTQEMESNHVQIEKISFSSIVKIMQRNTNRTVFNSLFCIQLKACLCSFLQRLTRLLRLTKADPPSSW